ncbi:hypothetical protein QQ045_025192 [Rhodiola kirilowii]
MAGPGLLRPPVQTSSAQKESPGALDANAKPSSTRSFADIIKTKGGSRFPPIQLAPHELRVGVEHLKFSLVAKVSGGRPPIDKVRKAFLETWSLVDKASIGAWDARHILIVLESEQDACKVLASPTRKLGLYMFRVFWWTKDFNTRQEPSITTAWITEPCGSVTQVMREHVLKSISRRTFPMRCGFQRVWRVVSGKKSYTKTVSNTALSAIFMGTCLQPAGKKCKDKRMRRKYGRRVMSTASQHLRP